MRINKRAYRLRERSSANTYMTKTTRDDALASNNGSSNRISIGLLKEVTYLTFRYHRSHSHTRFPSLPGARAGL
jgi:hypothetical protein